MDEETTRELMTFIAMMAVGPYVAAVIVSPVVGAAVLMLGTWRRALGKDNA